MKKTIISFWVYINKQKYFVFVSLLIILNCGSVFAQSHGYPSSMDEYLFTRELLPSEKGRISISPFYSVSNDFWTTEKEKVDPTSYENYRRYGCMVSYKRKVFTSSLVSIRMSWMKSSVNKLLDSWDYTSGKYSLSGIGDIDLGIGQQILKNSKFDLLGILELGLPVNSAISRDRISSSEYIYLNNDGHKSLKITTLPAFNLSKRFALKGTLSYMYTLSKTRYFYRESKAQYYYGEDVNYSKCTLDPRDYFYGSVYGNYKDIFNGFDCFLGYEHFHEYTDKITDIEPEGSATKTYITEVNWPLAYTNNAILGFRYNMKKQAVSLIFKTTINGKYSYNENIVAFLYEYML